VLTGLPNRRVTLETLEDVLGKRGAGPVAFALIDLDGFHEINDTLGRAGGDAMIVSIAERLKTRLPAGALLGRFDDDEFAVIAGGEDAGATTALAGVLTAALADPFYMDQMWQIRAGIGIAQSPEDGTTSDELNRHAALALRTAKREGRGVVRRFVPEIHAEHAERRFLRRELELAIFQQALDVHYQPVVAAAGGKVLGVEALLRWNHPTRGAIPPSLFVPLAEESGMMIQLGEIVLRRALADGVRWPDLFISVNISPVQIRDRGLVALVGAVMAETGIASSRVVLEVTESILIDNPEETQKRLAALRALGVSIALDDFGTGYSSLSYLQKFPFDRLKIDRAFVDSLGTTGNAGAIIQSIVTLGHALGMKVLAEGVETDEQRVLLRLAGCDEMQGFLFAKPRPAEAIDALVDKVVARGSSAGSAAQHARAAAR
jgi:diguanylate cyclase (GGDEF)-like protein